MHSLAFSPTCTLYSLEENRERMLLIFCYKNLFAFLTETAVQNRRTIAPGRAEIPSRDNRGMIGHVALRIITVVY